MNVFMIDTDKSITAFSSATQVPEGHHHFATEKELAKLSADWPINHFAEVWNAFAGAPPFGDLKPVKKFTDRKTATKRIWNAIQILGDDLLRANTCDAEGKQNAAPTALAPEAEAAMVASVAPQAAPKAAKQAKATKQATPKAATPTPREGSKKEIVLALIRRPKGATLAEIMTATGWQKHSVRGFICGALGKKMGLVVESFKNGLDERAYRLAK